MLGECEWVHQSDWYINRGLADQWQTDLLNFAVCCLCLQSLPLVACYSVLKFTNEGTEGYVVCQDCKETYELEPWRAWIEAHDWVKTVTLGRL